MKRRTIYSHVIGDARAIARDALRQCVTKDGIVAGQHHFVDLWARDSLFATFGANRVGLSDVSRRTIETFLSHQRPDGLVPFLIRRSKLSVGRYFGRHAYFPIPRAQFRSSQSGGIVPDGGLMAVIASREYAKSVKDTIFLKRQYVKFERALEWYHKKFGDKLIREWFLCEWADAVMKTGMTLYTNVLYWKALGDMAWMAKQCNKDGSKFLQRQHNIEVAIRTHLWNGEYFADWKSIFRHDYFSSHGNMLAVVWGLASRQQAETILSYAGKYCWNSFTLETNYPKYPAWRIPVINYLAGMADYHNRGCLWLQPGILYAVALKKQGYVAEAKMVLEKVANKIIKHRGVYEVYEKDGVPVGRLLYRSEYPFAWSAGLFLWGTTRKLHPISHKHEKEDKRNHCVYDIGKR